MEKEKEEEEKEMEKEIEEINYQVVCTSDDLREICATLNTIQNDELRLQFLKTNFKKFTCEQFTEILIFFDSKMIVCKEMTYQISDLKKNYKKILKCIQDLRIRKMIKNHFEKFINVYY